MEPIPPERTQNKPSVRAPYWPRPLETSLTYVGHEAPDFQGKISLSWIKAVFKRRAKLMALGFALVMGAAVIYTWRAPRIYKSSATILVETRGGPQTESALEVLQRLGRANTLETEIELITSRRVLEPVVLSMAMNVKVGVDGRRIAPEEVFTSLVTSRDTEPGEYRLRIEGGQVLVHDVEADSLVLQQRLGDGDATSIAFAGLTIGVPPDLDGEVDITTRSFGGTVGGALRNVTASPVRREADLIRIVCSRGSPRQAFELCSNVTDSYFALRSELQQAEATGAADFLGDQVDQVRGRLTEAENELAEYQSRNQAVALAEQAGTEVSQFAQIRSQRDQLQAERSALQSLIAAVESSGGSSKYRDLASYPTFLKNQNEVVSELIQNLVSLENRRADLAVTRTDRNPDIVAIDVRIREIESQLGSFANSYLNALENQIGSLNTTLASSGGRLSSIPGRQVETGRLARQVGLLEDLYQFLQIRLREAEVAKVVNLPSVRIVDEASMPIRPAAPDVRVNLMLGFLLGLCVGGALAAARELTDSRIRERRDVERDTGIPVLAMIPSLRRPGPIIALGDGGGNGHKVLAGGDGGGKEAVGRAKAAAPTRSWESEIVMEAFRSLAADLRFTGLRLGDQGLRSVAVTSSSRGDGKTFTACNLAIAYALQGHRTLIVDADLRASGVARFFDIPWTSRGFTDVLTGEAEAPSVVSELTIGDETSLRVLSSGNPRVRSTGMLEKNVGRVRSVLEYAESNFDLVVVDTPPLNVLTDAATIASRVDAVVVVVRGGVTDKSALDLTLKRLERANARVVGLVLNDVDLPEYYTTYSQDFTGEEP